MQSNSIKPFHVALILSLFFAMISFVLFIWKGKEGSFLLINGDHGSFADVFFKYVTYLGDGMAWIPVGLFCILARRKYLIPFILVLVISTVLTQFLKRVVFPDELRPVAFVSENFPVHFVEGVKINRHHSFPSGHSAVSFSIALFLAYIINNKTWTFILPILALMAAVSRVYLGQHFVSDIAAGMAIGIFSAYISLLIAGRIRKEKM